MTACSIWARPAVDPELRKLRAEELIDWMVDDHFTFLGYREYKLSTIVASGYS